MDKYIYVIWTSMYQEHAQHTVQRLLEKELIACAHIFPTESYFCWQGEYVVQKEWNVTMTTKQEKYPALQQALVEYSTDEVPQIIALPIIDGLPSYLQWMDQVTT